MRRFEQRSTRPARPAPPAFRAAANRVVGELAKATKYVEPALMANWAAIVGDDIAAVARPGRITGGRADRTLEVHVRDGAAAARLGVLEGLVKERLNTYFGPSGVARVKIIQSGGAPSGGLGRFRIG